MTSTKGYGSVVGEPIAAGEIVAAFGGRCVRRDEFDLLPASQQVRSVQIDENLYMAGAPEPEPADFINHSCDPNCVLSGNVLIVAARDIAVGEEVTYDYATTDGSDYDEFECSCGTSMCRGKVSGHDWMLPELQLRYRGSFSPYLAKRIAALVNVGAERRAFAL
ncbi:MAG: SET domain-containing protein-lysine N-methyltransferase [Ilumatobacteraceae bacterium]